MEEYSQEGVNALAQAGRAIPGQSLTANPDEPRPFEGAPDFTNFKEALDYTAAELLLEENYMPLMMAIGDGVPIVDLATQIGYVGFREGKWNPDLMMMLLEPIMYLLMALAEKAGIEYRIDSEDDDEDEDSIFQEKTNNIAQSLKNEVTENKGVPAGVLPKNIVAEIEELEIPSKSLLAKQEEEPQSLLGRGQ
jgi:hypothetical protein